MLKSLLFISVVVTIIQFSLLQPSLKMGFKPDDWSLYFTFRTLGSNPLSKLPEVWSERGLYTTNQVFYMGLLNILTPFNFRSFQTISLIFKTFATILIFFVVISIYKDKLLAVFSTLIFALSSASIGPLEFAVKGGDYLAISCLCLFLIFYVKTLTIHAGNLKWVFFCSFLLILTIIFSPIRSFPILFILPFIEFFLWINKPSIKKLKEVLIRVSIFYLPYFIAMRSGPDSTLGLFHNLLGLWGKIMENKFLILSPLAGMGYTIIPLDNWHKVFGSLNFNSFSEYLLFLAGGPTIILGLLTLVFSLNAKRPVNFFLKVISLNFCFELLIFFIINHNNTSVSSEFNFDQNEVYPALIGLYVITISVILFLEWFKQKSNTFLLASWTGVAFLATFTIATWAFAPYGTTFFGSSYYLVIAAMGSSVFLGQFLLSIYKKAIINTCPKKISLLILLIFTSTLITLINVNVTTKRFAYLLANGRSSLGQQIIQGKFREKIKDIDLFNSALFYFDTSDLSGEGPFYSEGFLASFPYWMHFLDNKLIDGCVEIFYENKEKLVLLIKQKNNQTGFVYRSVCVTNGKSSYNDIFYKLENFYAFKIKSRDFIDIKKELLEDMKISSSTYEN